jgi:predicted acylesterase/phospholipase RssA
MSPPEMARRVLGIQRKDIWDLGGVGGLLKGDLFQQQLASNLLVQEFAETKLPLGMTAFDLFKLRTNPLIEGNIAAAVRASCTFPGLFQPIIINGAPHIDGGVWDHDGMMALEACFQKAQQRVASVPVELATTTSSSRLARDNMLVVNVVFDSVGSSRLPVAFDNCRVSSVCMCCRYRGVCDGAIC